MSATFDFYIADSRCRATFEATGSAIRVLSVVNITHDDYQHPVGITADMHVAIAALIADRKAAA